MRKGVIDLGTNTFNLLIAETSETNFRVIHAEKDGVALGMGGINKNVIAEDAMERALVTLKRFYDLCSEHSVQYISAFGTSALRGAENAHTFLNRVRQEVGMEVYIISGLEEAELIYQGVRWSYNFQESGVIMDIGGGSTEFIQADDTGMKRAVSLDIGVSRMYQQLQLSDPFTPEDVATIERWLEAQSKGKLDDWKSELLIGASGTFETFYELHHSQKFPVGQESIPMKKADLIATMDAIIASTLKEREQNPYIIPIRQKMAPIAAVKIKWVLQKLEVKNVLISPCSLKEGALRLEN